jgi:peroxiredoxin 2/4
MSLVGKKAPLFTAPAVINGEEIVEKFSLEQFIGKQEVILFFYPFQEVLAEFEKRNVAVIGCSTDTEETHLAWLSLPKNKGGIQGVTYPIVADTAKTIATNYGVLAGEYSYNEDGQLEFQGDAIAYRGTFFIDLDGIVRHEVVNFFPLGRNINEALRIVDAWQYFTKHGEVCPANWEEGKEAMKATREGVAEYLSKN